jgi:hypothetical protein
MAQVDRPKTLADKLMSVPRLALYITLMVVTTVMLFVNRPLPVKGSPSSVGAFSALMGLNEGTTIIIQSDWTTSTRGENAGQLEALVRLCMKRNIKFVFYSMVDPQAPQVARDVIMRINLERAGRGEREYRLWDDYLDLGYFPNAEGTANAMASNVREAWRGRTGPSPDGPRDVFQSPVLAHIRRIEDFPLMVIIHASAIINTVIERIPNVAKLSMCTGVQGPETLIYFASGQLVGVSVGLNGVVELEAMIELGTHPDGDDGRVRGGSTPIDGLGDGYARGMRYYLSLHAAMFLMILAVIIGNIGMVMARKAGGR